MYARTYIAYSWKTTIYYVIFFLTIMISNFKYKSPPPPGVYGVSFFDLFGPIAGVTTKYCDAYHPKCTFSYPY